MIEPSEQKGTRRQTQAVPLPVPRVAERDSRAEVFVRACGHAALDAAALAALRQLGTALSASEWNEVLGYALVERMECLTYAHLAAAGLLPALPDRIQQTFAQVYRGTLVTNLRLRNATLGLIEALRARGIRAVCVKGVALALRTYHDLAHRPMGDIDLLIEWPAVTTATALLRELEYAPLPGMERPLAFRALQNRALVFERPDPDGCIVELHWALSGLPPYAQRFASANVWSRVRQVRLPGLQDIAGIAGIQDQVVWQLHPYDELRYLCFHYAAQHQAQRLLWLVDIAELVSLASAAPAASAAPSISRAMEATGPETPWQWQWAEFAAETIALGLALPVAVSLDRARRLLGTAVPEEALQQLTQAARARAERAGWRAAQASPYRPDTLLRYLLALDTASQRLAFLGGATYWGPRAWAGSGYRALRRAAHSA